MFHRGKSLGMIQREAQLKQLMLMKEARDLGSYQKERLTKWQNDKIMQTIITKDTFKGLPNERYFQVRTQIH